MSDSLIRNLRDLASCAHADLSVADEAADEIERLRAALQAIHKHQKRMPTIDVTIWELTRAALGEKE